MTAFFRPPTLSQLYIIDGRFNKLTSSGRRFPTCLHFLSSSSPSRPRPGSSTTTSPSLIILIVFFTYITITIIHLSVLGFLFGSGGRRSASFGRFAFCRFGLFQNVCFESLFFQPFGLVYGENLIQISLVTNQYTHITIYRHIDTPQAPR